MCAQEARWQLGLDEVLLMPVGEAPHRRIEHDPGAEERLELCRLAAESVEWLTASRAEVDRHGPSYTVDTLEQLHGERPDAGVCFVMGADQALQFATWREPQRVLELAALAIAERDGVAMEDVRSALAAVGDARVEQFAMPRIDVSSTDVRRRVAAGRPYEFLVPERVAARIEQRGLYR